MDRLRRFVEALRVMAQANDSNRAVLIENAINEYLKGERGDCGASSTGTTLRRHLTAKMLRSVEARIGAKRRIMFARGFVGWGKAWGN